MEEEQANAASIERAEQVRVEQFCGEQSWSPEGDDQLCAVKPAVNLAEAARSSASCPGAASEFEKPAAESEQPSRTDAPLVQGSLWKAIWLMSWPLLITTVATSLVGMADVQVAGYLGASVQAAVGLSEHVLFLFMIFLFSISTGTTAIVSRHFGEGNLEETNRATAQSLVLAFTSGLVLCLLGLNAGKVLLPLFARSAEVQALAAEYLGIYGWYLIPFSITCIAGAAFRAIGDAKTPLLIVLTQVTINIAGDYLTVKGNWPVAGLGIKGIAWSAVVASVCGAAIALWVLSKSKLSPALRMVTHFSKELQVRILKIGLPSAFQRLGWAMSVFVVFFILRMVKEPTEALAAWTIGMRVEGLLFMPMMALSLAVSSIVGQNLGAGREDRAVKAGWDVTTIGVIMMLVLGACLFFSADFVAAVMSTDAKTRAITADYLRINALSEPFLAVAMILSGALQGAGETKWPMWISIITNWIVRLPLAWLLAVTLGLGPGGVWWAMTISMLVYAALMIWRYRDRSWLRTTV